MLLKRTQSEINTQAKHLFINIYERMHGVNLYGVLPMKELANREYKKVKAECIAIAIRYEDAQLIDEFRLNF